MREIKFRGIDIISKDFVYGDLIHGVGAKSGKVYILPNRINLAYVKNCDPLDGVKVVPESVGQFCGLKDKNGKEIYSGDLYQVAGNKIYEVRYVDKMQVQSGGFETFGACFVLWISEELFFPFDEYAMEHGEIIGNIYETPTP